MIKSSKPEQLASILEFNSSVSKIPLNLLKVSSREDFCLFIVNSLFSVASLVRVLYESLYLLSSRDILKNCAYLDMLKWFENVTWENKLKVFKFILILKKHMKFFFRYYFIALYFYWQKSFYFLH